MKRATRESRSWLSCPFAVLALHGAETVWPRTGTGQGGSHCVPPSGLRAGACGLDAAQVSPGPGLLDRWRPTG